MLLVSTAGSFIGVTRARGSEEAARTSVEAARVGLESVRDRIRECVTTEFVW